MPQPKKTKMIILDPLSGNRVTVHSSGKTRRPDLLDLPFDRNEAGTADRTATRPPDARKRRC
jgi:hypothetical protein